MAVAAVPRVPKKFKSRPVTLPEVRPPFRAEKKRSAAGLTKGPWRAHIEEAMSDARQLGTGARVVSENGVLLARFENATKSLPKSEKLDAFEREPEVA
jgi:hypothetical protein